jgi:TolA-binding protein
MRRFITSIIILIIFCVGLNLSAPADDGDIYYEFLKNSYNQNDKKLYDYLLAELDLYIQLFPDSKNSPAAGFLMAQIYANKGNNDIAYAMLMKQLYFYPNSPIHSRIVEEAKKIIIKNNRYKSRLEELTQLIDGTFPECDRGDCYYSYLAFLYDLDVEKLYNWNLKEYYDFIAYNKADDRVEQVHRWIADTYDFKKDVSAAQSAYLKYEQFYPESSHIAYIKTRRAKILYENLKDFETALEILTQVIASYPMTDYAGSALYLRGEIKMKKQKDYNGAIADFRQLVTDLPGHDMGVDALFNIAEINHEKLKASKTAIGVYNEIVDLYPDDIRGVKALEEAAEIQMKLKAPLLAAQQYAKIASQFPGHKEAPQMLIKAGGICESKAGNYAKAIEYYQLIVDNYIDTDYAEKAEKRIVKIRTKMGE